LRQAAVSGKPDSVGWGRPHASDAGTGERHEVNERVDRAVLPIVVTTRRVHKLLNELWRDTQIPFEEVVGADLREVA